MSDFDDLRKALVARRHALGWSQAEAARRIGCGQPHLSALEKGLYMNPGFKVVLRWIAALGGTLPLEPRWTSYEPVRQSGPQSD